MGKTAAINGIAGGVRKALRAKNDRLDWSVVAVAGKAFSDKELCALLLLGMPTQAFAVLTHHRGWSTAQLGSIANKARFIWKMDPLVVSRLQDASKKLWADIKKGRVISP